MSQPSLRAPTPVLLPPVASEPQGDDPLFHLLFTQSPLYVGVLEWLGDDGRYLSVNPATALRLGRPVDEIRGARARDLGLPADACAAWAQLAGEAERRHVATRGEWEARTPHGVSSFRTTVVPLPTPAGSAPRFAFLTEELTAKRALERRLGTAEALTTALEDVEQPLAQALDVLQVVGDEVETLADIHPDLELEDAVAGLRDATRHSRRAHQRLRELLFG